MYFFDADSQKVKIPIRITNGEIKYYYGGDLPVLKDGIIGDLTIPEYGVQDETFLKTLQFEEFVELFPNGTTIYVVVVDGQGLIMSRTIADKINSEFPMPSSYKFIEVILKEPLKLHLRGNRRSKLIDTKCFIPSLDDVAESLNNTYTKISEKFETTRRSHTGNVFHKCFYYGSNMELYAIDYKRKSEEVRFEEKLFLDHRIFTLTDKHEILSHEKDFFDDEEKFIIRLLIAKGNMSVKEIKEYFDPKKREYIVKISSLIHKGAIIEKKL